MSKRFTYYGSFNSASGSLLLDLYPNAVAAYSVRKLRTAYAGSAIRVRRGSDNTEQDIGFDGNDLDTAALLSFVGAGNGYVRTWYDQSGAGNDAQQATTANQFIIVNSGTLVTQGGIVALDADISSSGMDLPAGMITGSTNRSSFCVVKCNTVGGLATGTIYGLRKNGVPATGEGWNVSVESGGFYIRVVGSARYSYPAPNTSTTHSVFSTIFAGTTVNHVNNWQNGTSMPQVSASGATINTLGDEPGTLSAYSYGSSADRFRGVMQEIILYDTNRTSDRAGIESNMNTYFSIY